MQWDIERKADTKPRVRRHVPCSTSSKPQDPAPPPEQGREKRRKMTMSGGIISLKADRKMRALASQSQKVKKSMTPTRPALIPAISLLGDAGLLVDDGDAAVPLLDEATVRATVAVGAVA